MYIVISTAQTDLGLRSRTFCLKINKLPTFSKNCAYMVRRVHLLNFNFPLHSKPELNTCNCTTTIKSLNCDNNNKFCLLVSDESMF